MDKVQEHLIKVDNYLITMEHGGHSATKEDTDAAAAAKAKQECNDVAKALEEDTKRVMEATGRTFLKEKMESSKTLGIPEIMEQVINNLFTQPEPKAPQRRCCHHHYCTPPPIQDPSRSSNPATTSCRSQCTTTRRIHRHGLTVVSSFSEANTLLRTKMFGIPCSI